MSIENEYTRLLTSRDTIREKLVSLGLASDTDKFDALAEAISEMINRGAVSIVVKEGETVTIPAGYYNGSGTVSGVAGGGNYALQSKSVTPTKSSRVITPDSGYYGLSDVAVAPIPGTYQDVTSVTAKAGDVLEGKIIVGAEGEVEGTVPKYGAQKIIIDGLTRVTYNLPVGYITGGTVTFTDDIEKMLAAL